MSHHLFGLSRRHHPPPPRVNVSLNVQQRFSVMLTEVRQRTTHGGQPVVIIYPPSWMLPGCQLRLRLRLRMTRAPERVALVIVSHHGVT